MRSWNLRYKSGSYHKKLVCDIRQILKLISINKIILMLKSVLKDEEKKELLNKHIRALNNFGNVYNSTKQKQRHKLLSPLKQSGLSFNEVCILGFDATKYMWKNCQLENDYGEINFERDKGGRHKLDETIKNEIEAHLESLSHLLQLIDI